MPDLVNEAAKMLLEKLTNDRSLLQSVIGKADIADIAAKALVDNPKFSEFIKKIAGQTLAKIESGDAEVDVESIIINACDEEKLTDLIKYNPIIQESLNASLSKLISGKIDDALENDSDINDNIDNALVPSEDELIDFIQKDETIQTALKAKIAGIITEQIEKLDGDTENCNGEALSSTIDNELTNQEETIRTLLASDPDLKQAQTDKIKELVKIRIDGDDENGELTDAINTQLENYSEIFKDLMEKDPEIQAAKKEKIKRMILQELAKNDDEVDDKIKETIRKELRLEELLKEVLADKIDLRRLVSESALETAKRWMADFEREGRITEIVGKICVESSTVKGIIDRAIYSANSGKLERFVNDLVEQIFKGKSQALTDKIAAQLSDKLGAEIARRI